MISKEAEAFRLQVEQRLRSAEETSSVLAEIVDLAHVQMKSGIRPSRSHANFSRERLTVKSLEISDHINRTIKRHDDLEYSQIASKKSSVTSRSTGRRETCREHARVESQKSVDYPQRSSSVANILAPLAIPEAPVPTLPLNPILPTSLKTAGPGALHPARKASLTTNFAAYPNSLLFLKMTGISLKLSVLAHDGPTSSKTVISPSTSPNLASGSDLHTKVGHPANSGAHVPVAATLLPPTDSAQKRDNSSLVSLAGTIAGKRV
ncbi:hypothetical protein BASA61_010479 [Batrachochytrium salamandrivorans]|nr:hypothetical protein BASA61_010479 [Batrachochytrium salamandrivorans]